MKERLITQEEFIEMVKRGKISARLAVPAKFANGYFVTGKFGKEEIFYSTIEKKDLIKLTYNKTEQGKPD